MLSKDEVKHIARLARIGLEEKDIERFQMDLSAVLGSFRELEQANVEGISPFDCAPGMTNALREDVSHVPDKSECCQIVGAFPRKSGNALLVKAVF